MVTAQQAGDSDGPYRVAVARTRAASGKVTVYAALPTDEVRQSTNELVAALGVGVPFMVIALALVGWFLVGRALHPVELIRRQAAAIPGTDLGGRLGDPASDDELGRLANTFNELLGRIESSAGRQRQFVADAAHELRSPIAALRTQLEVAQLHPDLAATRSRGMLEDTERLSNLVDDLLALARMDANPHQRRQLVDLDDVVLREATAARGRGVRIDASGVSAARASGDPTALDRVARNLVGNAVRHAASIVVLQLAEHDGLVTFVVADDGTGIPEPNRERVFERFTRLDEARSRDAGGAGLGLAIVRDVVMRHGGQVAIEDNHPGAKFTVTLPAAS